MAVIGIYPPLLSGILTYFGNSGCEEYRANHSNGQSRVSSRHEDLMDGEPGHIGIFSSDQAHLMRTRFLPKNIFPLKHGVSF
jgi:hypothetical protein